MKKLLLCLLVLSTPVLAETFVAWPIFTVKLLGARHSYSAVTGKVYYDQHGVGACTTVYSIREINLDGTGDTNKTCGVYAMNSHYGMPQVSPNGAWMLALRHDTTLTGTGCDTLEETQPGLGDCNDLVIIELADGDLTVLVEGTNDLGTAEQFRWPQWSADQTMIMWAQMNNTAVTIRTATITLGATPAISNIQQYAPADADGFYEPWGWLDAAKTTILLACLCEVGDVANDIDLASYNVVTGVFTRLTNTNEILEEHATPDLFGRDLILYTCNADSTAGFFDWDFCTMRRDGTDKRRVTYFNEPTHQQFCAVCGEYFTMANPVWVTATSFLMHGTYDWAYPSQGNLILMAYGSTYTDAYSIERAGRRSMRLNGRIR